MIRLIATDMDDTLLMPDGQIGQRTKDALSEAARRGVRVVLVSGRMPEAMLPFARELGCAGAIVGYNGAITVDAQSGEVLAKEPVPHALAVEAATLGRSLGGHVQAYQSGKYFFEKNNAYAQDYGASIGVAGQEVGMPIDRWLQGDADKLLVIGEAEKVAVWAPIMQAHFGERLCCAVSRPRYIEIFRAGVNKATALSALCASLGIAKDEVAAFGDGENDLPMLEFAGCGYAMKNANVSVRARAGHIAPSNAEEGLAQVVEGWLNDGTIPAKEEADA